MIATSQNGWSANDRSVIASYTIPGTNGKVTLRKGDISVILLDLAGWFNANVETLVWPGIWGYTEKTITGGSGKTLSNHASGTAVDLNAPKHPQGTNPTSNFSNEQIAKIRERVKLYGSVRWGGDYLSAKKDGMHFEWIGNANDAALVADEIRNRTFAGGDVYLVGENLVTPNVNDVQVQPSTPSPVSDLLKQGDSGEKVVAWQDELWRVGIGVGAHDGEFGFNTTEGTKKLQNGAGITVDGVVGPSTRSVATSVPDYPKAPGDQYPTCGPDGPYGTVFEFQKKLKDRGWNLSVDGRYGNETATIIRKFQAEKGLAVDGIGGGETWVALWTRQL